MNPILSAVILGVVEGLTEFLPISSTGHLIVAENLIGYRDAAETFTVVVQLGAILAVVWFYRTQLLERLRWLVQGSRRARRFWLNLVIASIPAAVLGLTLEKAIKAALFSPTVVAISLIVGGVILWVIEARRNTEPHPDIKTPLALEDGSIASGSRSSLEPGIDDITPRQALIVGLSQTVALVPGVSRSGASIVGGLLVGLDRATATAFSFFLGLPVLGGAGLYSLYKARHTLSAVPGGGSALLLGTLVSFITALLAVSWLLGYISKHDFRGFAIYRVVAGVAILCMVAIGVLGGAA